MAFTHRIAALAAVVAIPLGIAATSFALTDQPKSPEVPSRVELDSGSPTPTPSRSAPTPTPSDEVVSRPPVTDGSAGDDDDDDDRGEAGDEG
ncbi:small secreted hydrophilic protein [Streptomyces coerulescens]|uniref:Small secreted hydrophilic protein n=1 Tax=Streptomyces coerulescens TaxID=29304 RepID=A0ABW0CFB2_STRCD